jgi:hypothetical protein
MARKRDPQDSEATSPAELPQTNPPRALYSTEDARAVFSQISSLSVQLAGVLTKVERLMEDVKGYGKNIDDLRHQSTFIKGAVAAATLLIGAFMAIAGFFLSSKYDDILEAIRHASEKPSHAESSNGN